MTKSTGAENTRWDLTDLYADIGDDAIDRDLAAVLARAKQFDEDHRGTLATTLGAALTAQAQITETIDKLMVYLFLQRSTDATNAKIQQRIGQIHEAWSRAHADHMTFFEHELTALSDAEYANLLEHDSVAKRHQSMLDHLRQTARYLLDETVERALTLRSPFGAGEWADYAEEWEAELRFDLDGEQKTLPEILHAINNSPDTDKRADALEAFSTGLTEQRFVRFSARTLNVTLGAKSLEDRERGYESPMSARNIGNRVDDTTVEALHDAVQTVGAEQCRRYYRLLSKHLGIAPLRWSDRNAPLPFQDTRTVPWDECISTVLAAYGSFSPTLEGLLKTMLDRKWVDAPPDTGKVGGAFNYSVCLPGNDVRAYNFLNYLGSTRDVMTVAHELGHGAHGMLAGVAQGPLLFRAPMVYAETASIFGEMTTFKYVLANAETDQQRLALLMGKSNDFLNSVVRQISFSNFERKIHERRSHGKLTVEELNETWLAVTRDFYGEPGDLFTYDNTENLWAYVSHFLRPFYVYAYAFGELFTQSLFAVRDQFGDDFEPMYLDLLRAGGTKSAVELMKPFGLDPRTPEFWREGVLGSIKVWLDEAERITEALEASG